ncbi:hypothetical protein SEA_WILLIAMBOONE_122 [Gordonia phage WilliamBoone]|nr:hypothetical protein SEA_WILLIAMBOONE_122 [Gordonia phage WilliamBoone]
MASEDELRAIAREIAIEELEDLEFFSVYEDTRCEELDEDDLQRIHEIITKELPRHL